jgi:DNA-binding NarL/FixJ family response regulator
MITILLADDQPLIRGGLSLLLGAEPGMRVVGEAGDGAAAVAQARALAPDVVVMDVRMPGMDGVAATRELAADGFRVLVLTNYHEDRAVREALRAGASGFLLKDAAPFELAAAIRAVHLDKAWLDPVVARGLLADFRGVPEAPAAVSADLGRITPREREVLVLIALGLTNEQISGHLMVAQSTIKTHVSRILVKLGLHERAQAVVAAYRGELVRPGDPVPPRR